MRHIKKLLSFALAAAMLLSLSVTVSAAQSSSDAYKGWSMHDSRWADTVIGDPAWGITVSTNGSRSVALAKLMIQAGLRDPEEFDVRDVVAAVNSQDGFEPSGDHKSSAEPFSDFPWTIIITKSSMSNLSSRIRSGYHLAVKIEDRGQIRWLAVDNELTLKHNETYVMDCIYTDPAKNVGIRLADLKAELGSSSILQAVGYKGGNKTDVCFCSDAYQGTYKYEPVGFPVRPLPIYSGHGEGYEQVGEIQPGETFQVSKGNLYSSFTWLHVKHNGLEGLVRQDYQVKQVGFVVSYDANGGKNAPSPQNKSAGEDLYLSEQEPTRPGYTFLGWSASPDNSSTLYHPGGVYSADANVTLYARWEQTPPEKPHKIVNVVNGVHVYWKAVDGADKYGVWRSETGKDGTYKWLGNPTVPHFTDTTAESGKTYFYKVSSMDKTLNIHSEQSEALGIIFVSTPDIAKRENIAEGIKLDWEPIPGATGYAIYRKPYDGDADWVRVATIAGNDTLTWTDSEVKNSVGSVYKYTIRALAGKDMSTLSGCRAAGRTMVRLSSLYVKSAQQVSDTAVKCSWSTSKAATGYEVRFMVGDQVYKTFTVGNYKSGTKTFTGLEAGQEYTVLVRSYRVVDGVGSFYSAWSAPKNVTG